MISEPMMEFTERFAKELGVSTLEELKAVPQSLRDKAFLKIYSTNLDGTLRKGVEHGYTNEVITSLREEYGDRILEEEYKQIERKYGDIILHNHIGERIQEGVMWAMLPGLRETPIGQHFREKITSIINRDLAERKHE